MYFPFSHINPARIAITYVTLSTWLIMGAFFLQIFMDIRPCELCLWQRIPHYIVMFGAVLVPLRFLRLTFITQAIGYFANVLLSAYHSGIERKWWAGLEGCSSADMKNLSIAQIHERLLNTQIIKCDEIAWEFLGLSLTNYNFIICLVLGISVLYFIGGYGEQSKSIR
ncbi:MAG: disulfide bond formation protein DsbB [Alphaproteobacteria bacterium]|jgi:disulfide bond formation protein DsbB